MTQEAQVVNWNCPCGNLIKFHGFTEAPQRTWQGLTADELNMIGDRMRTWNSHSLADVYVAIEAKLKQKNGFAEENT